MYCYDPEVNFSNEKNLSKDLCFDVDGGYDGHIDYNAMTLSDFANMKTLTADALKARANSDALMQHEAIKDACEFFGDTRTVRYWAELYGALRVYIESWYVGAIESGGPLGHSA